MRSIICAIGLSLALAATAWASVTGSITGTIKDNTGAVMPGVTVTATELAKGVKSTTQTNAEGVYSFLALPAGRYQIDVQMQGFKDFRKTDITLNANSVLRMDIPLEVGSITDTVEVTGSAVRVETTSTQLGDVIDSTKMTTQPLNGRSYIDLLGLQPGVNPVNSGNAGGEVSGNLAGGNISVSGARQNANGFMVNGGSVEEQVNNGTAIIPNLDSIAEFRVLTNAFDAEYGHYNGGLINVITKSGANAFHGSAFQFFRNQKLDANNYFNNYNNVDKGDYERNQYGGTFGGAIRHDKAFFFVDYQGTRENIGTPLTTVVPSDAQRGGDLSDIADSLTGNVNGGAWAQLLSSRLGYAVRAGEPYYTPGCANAAQCVFPGGRIPAAAFAAPVKPLLGYLPHANGSLEDQPSFSTSAFNHVVHDHKWSARVDANTRFGLLSGYYFFDQAEVGDPYPAANVPGFDAITTVRAQQANLSATKTFGTAVNEFRFNFVRNAILRDKYVGGVGVSLDSLGFVTGADTLGIVGVIPGLDSVPNVATNNWTIGTPQGFTGQYHNMFQWLDNYSVLRGSHTLKLGGEFHYSQINERNIYAPNGSFEFDGSETGSDLADFLIGAPATYVQATQQVLDSRTIYYGIYGQDSWRLNPTMTLNYGLRWEVSPFWWDTQNKIQTIVPGQQSTVYPGAPTGWLFPGDEGIPKTLAPTTYNNFAPRVGFAYSPDVKGEGFLSKLFGAAGESSIHAAWGLFYTSTDDSQLFIEVGDAPFGLYYFSPAPPMFETPFVDRATGTSQGQRFPRPIPQPGDTNIDWPSFLPIASSPGIWVHNKLPYSQNFSVSFQRQIGPRMVWSGAYVGTKGRRMLAAVEANPGYADICLGLSQVSQVAPDSPTCGPNGENVVYTRANGEIVNGTRAPLGIDFAAGNQYMMTIAKSDYNSFQTSLRYSGSSASFLASYTFGKVTDNSSTRGDALNPFDYQMTRALSSFDVRHNFVISYSYTLPFEKWLGHQSAWFGGWALSGVTRMMTGFPITLSENDDRSLIGTFGVDRPQFNGGDLTPNNPRDTLNWINDAKTTFSLEPLGQVGNAQRRFFHGPGINNTDLALFKNVNLTPGASLQFRAELFNAFNHAQFLNPSGNINSSSFMVVRTARDPRIGQLAVKFLF